jgi:CrcB protein
MNVIAVFIGGGLGSVVRYLFGLLFQRSTLSLPISTLLANIIACLIFAIILKFFALKLESTSFKLFLLTGICGGLSTFSTFSAETAELMKQGNTVWAILNILISVSLCIGIFFLFNPKTIA